MANQTPERESIYTDCLDLGEGFSLFPGLGEMLIATYAEDGREKTIAPETLESSGQRSSPSDRTTTEAPEALSEVYRQPIPRLTTPATSRKPMDGRTVAAICHGRIRKPTPRRKRLPSPACSSASKGLSASSEARSGTLEQERTASGSELKISSAISMETLPEQSTSSQKTDHHVKSAQQWYEEVVANFCKFVCANHTRPEDSGRGRPLEVPAEATILLSKLRQKEHFKGRTEIPRWFEPWVLHARSRGIAWWHPPLDPDSPDNPAVDLRKIPTESLSAVEPRWMLCYRCFDMSYELLLSRSSTRCETCYCKAPS
ncbi:hypothetical protein FFLO_07087 [Filobasidium floriforme]|uniref:Uncharacterized protein n=1 Tax=Filobasidium floriforme TaxID=5210 RepID=A0A8K0JDZ6_9TREE|nr:hypothetical protein FFLO_07087 [Filobasidium floriforme]